MLHERLEPFLIWIFCDLIKEFEPIVNVGPFAIVICLFDLPAILDFGRFLTCTHYDSTRIFEELIATDISARDGGES